MSTLKIPLEGVYWLSAHIQQAKHKRRAISTEYFGGSAYEGHRKQSPVTDCITRVLNNTSDFSATLCPDTVILTTQPYPACQRSVSRISKECDLARL